MEEILLRIGFNLEIRRLSRISRSNLELPDVSIVKSESEMLCPEQPTFVRLKAYFQLWTKLHMF